MMDLFVSATTKVRRMLDRGFHPVEPNRPPGRYADQLPAGPRWSDGHHDGGPVTPPEGVVLDHLLYLDADQPIGSPHFHSYLGGRIRHTHPYGRAAHQHHPGEDRPSWPPAGATVARTPA